MLFHIFPNDLFLCIKKLSLYSYADDNTLSTFPTKIDSVVKILSEESKSAIDWLHTAAIDWLHTNGIIVNSQKFKTILISKIKNAIPEKQTIYIDDAKNKPKNSVKVFWNYHR